MQKNKLRPTSFYNQLTKIIIISSISLYPMLITPIAFAAESMTEEAIEQRIKPVGQVDVEQQEGTKTTTDNNNQAAATTKVAQPMTGEEVFQRYCSVCHASGVAGAPKAGNAADWQERSKKGIDGLLADAIHGLNVMPPRGTCADCTDAELKAAIEYMLKK